MSTLLALISKLLANGVMFGRKKNCGHGQEKKNRKKMERIKIDERGKKSERK